MGRVSEHTEEDMKEAVEALSRKTGKEVAVQFGVSLPTIYNWKRKLEGKPRSGTKRKAKAKADGAEVLPLVPATQRAVVPVTANGLGAQVAALESENAQLRAALAKLKDAFVSLAGESLAG
jgi:transposase-like protein